MQNVLLVLQALLGFIVTVLILVQVKGTGFGRAWGGDSVSFKRRGLERIVFRATFVVVGLFVALSIIQLF